MKHYNIPIFINHIGCPNSCVFCNQEKINGIETDITPKEVKKIIEEYLEFLPEAGHKEVAFFGGTFTGISFELQNEYLKIVKPFIDSKKINGIRISTRPDSINQDILDQLKYYGVKVIELGVQSLNQKVLDLTERNYLVEEVENASKLIKKNNIKLGIQLMIGLPGSSSETEYETAKKTINLKPDMVRIYPALVLKDTKMEEMYRDGTYTPLTLEESVKIGTKIYSMIETEDIEIIRVGLQPSEDLRKEGIIVAGPFHPAFRELLEGEIYYEFLKKINSKKLEILEVIANEKNISKIVGIKGINKIRLKELRIKIDNNLRLDEFLINGKRYTRKNILNSMEEK